MTSAYVRTFANIMDDTYTFKEFNCQILTICKINSYIVRIFFLIFNKSKYQYVYQGTLYNINLITLKVLFKSNACTVIFKSQLFGVK